MKRLKLLVIDDDDKMCKILSDIFTDEGFHVEYALDGQAGIKDVNSFKPNLILLDLKMPGMDGVEVLKKIKEINPHIGVVILTGCPSMESAISTLKMNALDYTEKPFKIDDLKAVVNKALEKLGLIRDLQTMINREIGKNIKSFRTEKRISVKELANKTGCAPSLISQIENAKSAASILTLYKIARALNVTVDKLVENV
ncbi:MAG: response regulator [Candidatus Ancaeobacter aquaticus]|nr:response regulator [Candidatus Ancaeobacter aquaticus]